MKKLIIIYIFLIFTTGIFAQSIYEKNGYWGVEYGTNISIPIEKSYYYGSLYNQESVLDITHKTTFGHYAAISRSIKLKQINETNTIFLMPTISYYQIKKFFNYNRVDGFNNTIESGKWEVQYKIISLNIRLKHIVTLSDKNALFCAINFETGLFHPSFYSIFTHIPSKKDWLFNTVNFSVGYTFKISNILLSPFIQYDIFLMSSTNRDYKSPFISNVHSGYDYYNIKSGIMLNFLK